MTSCSASGSVARTHLYSAPLEGGKPRPLVSEPGTVVSGASVAGSLVAVVLSTPTSYGEIAVVDLAGDGVEIRTATRPRSDGNRALHARGARVHDLGRHGRPGLAGPRPRGARPAAASARHPRRTAQRVERRRRPRAPLPPGAGRARLGRAAAQPARQRRLRRGLLHGGRRRLGRSGRAGLPRADRRPRRRRARRPGAARGHRLQLRRLHDLLPDEPRRPVRRGGRRRRRQRPGEHGRHVRRRAPALALRARRRRRGPKATGTARCRRSPAWTSVVTPTLVCTATADVRCPVGQAQQWHTALRERGVPTALVLYPDDVAPVHPRRQAVAPASTSTAASWIGWSSMPARRSARRRHDRRRALAASAGTCWPSGTSVPGAALGILRLRPTARTRSSRPPTAC